MSPNTKVKLTCESISAETNFLVSITVMTFFLNEIILVDEVFVSHLKSPLISFFRLPIDQ